MNNKKKDLFILLILLLLLVVGVSYAYFEAVVHGTGNTNAEGSAHTANIQDLILTGTTEVVNNNMVPGESSTYSFTIENPNDFQVCFGIYFDNVVNTFVNTSDLEVSMNGEVGLFPSTGDTSTIIGGFRAPANGTTSFTLTITYKDVEGKNQTSDMGKTFSGIIKARATECGLESKNSLNTLASLNSNYVLSNSDKCLNVDENGMILNPTSTMSDEETPIICAMDDDYGTSYYLRGLHTDNNVKFANMCWKLIRITGTGGYKLIYNGDLDENGKCTITSGEHTGFTGQTLSLSGNKVYGTSYTKEGSTYILTDTSTMDWTIDSASIIGKYTCGNTNASCANPYYVVSGNIDNGSSVPVLKIGISTNYAQIGTSGFNDLLNSVSRFGYMYSKDYYASNLGLEENVDYYFAESFTYNNGYFTLNNSVGISDPTNSDNQELIRTHRYTCLGTDENYCDEMYYVYRIYDDGIIGYVDLRDGFTSNSDTGPEVFNKMIVNDDINVKNSIIKEFIDGWYKIKLRGTEYENMLEDTIFCNDRTILNLNGWANNAVLTGTYNYLQFNAFDNNYYLKCPNKRDAFTVSDNENGNRALTYPIGIISTTELALTGNYTTNKTGAVYWTSSPNRFLFENVYINIVNSSGNWMNNNRGSINYGVRPAISLKTGSIIGGTGIASDPFVVE